MNKLTLKYELDLDFVLIAITCSLKDYLLCFKINRQLNVDFSKIDELSFQIKKEEPVYFSRYLHQAPGSETEFFLLGNKGSDGFLIPEMKQVDYFILIRNYIDDEDLTHFIDGLNKLPEVVVAVEVNPEKLKSKENLIF
ncbi:IPExxxVDY family protein [Pedobacter sp. SYSU D00535]|uniref:IPExxxVDY family protein n=1 Tax=Pedobacter sp. SYSU D00535 TaxID=2810308 RepID=UPI001A960E7B|nr:IPExxxVDY family protein [Pedobacter sp. SYSU D00535]